MSAEFEYLRTGQGMPDSQLLSINGAEGFFFFRLQTLHLAELQQFNQRSVSSAHTHNVFHMVFYTAESNRSSILLSGEKAESQPGMLVLTSPGEPHTFQPQSPGKTVYHELTFILENASGIFCGNWNLLMQYYSGDENVLIPSITLLDEVSMAALDKHFRYLGSQLVNLPGSVMPVFKGLMNMLEFVSSAVCLKKNLIVEDNVLDKVKFFIDKHFNEDLNLKELSRHFFMSPEHLCRKFKAAHGVSPLKYALELKMSAAKNMLLHSERSIKEISDRIGFSDVYAFSQSFKKNTGIPPGKYRHKAV